jgi:hypothetical protein
VDQVLVKNFGPEFQPGRDLLETTGCASDALRKAALCRLSLAAISPLKLVLPGAETTSAQAPSAKQSSARVSAVA